MHPEPLAWVPHISAVLMVLLVILATISEMMGVVAVQIGAKRQYQGPMGKSDRAFWLGALALALGLGLGNVAHSKIWLPCVLVMILVLLVLTIVNRAKGALKELKLMKVPHAN